MLPVWPWDLLGFTFSSRPPCCPFWWSSSNRGPPPPSGGTHALLLTHTTYICIHTYQYRKALICTQLLCRHNPSLLAQVGERLTQLFPLRFSWELKTGTVFKSYFFPKYISLRRVPSILVRLLEPVITKHQQLQKQEISVLMSPSGTLTLFIHTYM